jgi:alkanesulfonate monooxygenase SsuD/methylene tetrahydromethanopterin reductase-like flavin-dependent oxidoreductase (luciferase family)
MAERQIKLGAILTGVGGPGHHYTWLDPEIPGDASVDVNWFIEYARWAEAAKFDLVFIVDSQFITVDSPPHYLNRLEPLTLLSALAVTTRRIGLVGTITTSYNEFERALAEVGRPFGWHDFRQYDLDAPFPDVLAVAQLSFKTQAERITALARANGYTLRETVLAVSGPKPGPFVGSPETVADILEHWFAERALDGYNIHVGHPSQFRRFTDEVVPILRARGLVRKEYESDTLRGHLGLPVPENRHTVARRRSASDGQVVDPRPTGQATHPMRSAVRPWEWWREAPDLFPGRAH